MSFSGNQYPNFADKVITTRGDIIRGDSSGDRERYGIGAANTVLTSDGTDPDWAAAALAPTTTKGDISGYSTTQARIPISTNNYSLLADSAQALGLKWAASSTSTLTTTGDLLAASAANVLTRIAGGASGEILTGNGAGVLPTFQAASGAAITVLGRDTLVSHATSMEVASFTAKRYLQILTNVVPRTSGAVPDDLSYAFNGDNSSGNYSRRDIFNDSETTAVDQNILRIEGGSGTLIPRFASLWVVNIADQQKLCFGTSMRGAVDASTAPQNSTGAGLWDNEADQITTVTYSSAGTNSMAPDSELLVLGWD